jgi:hypothetical protein
MSDVLANEEHAVVAPGAPELAVEEIQVAQAGVRDGPTVAPPAEDTSAALAPEAVSAWHVNKKIVAMWCNSSTRNAYASVAGMGWRRISPSNDSAFVSLTAMLSHAEQTNANCRLRIENKTIVEAYVF